MGIDDGAVIAPDLRANGIAGLRIADASIMPNIVSGNTCSPTLMIAEKAAQLIREGHQAASSDRTKIATP